MYYLIILYGIICVTFYQSPQQGGCTISGGWPAQLFHAGFGGWKEINRTKETNGGVTLPETNIAPKNGDFQ